jgi:hypothetical protein
MGEEENKSVCGKSRDDEIQIQYIFLVMAQWS